MSASISWNSPDIVRDGLVLYLDASTSNSYNRYSSAGIWKDVNGNNVTGSLINGPTFSSDIASSINFDGIDDYFEVTNRNTNLEFQPTQPYSAFCWFKGPQITHACLISNLQASSAFPGWDIWFDNDTSPNTIAMHLISTLAGNNGIKVVVNYNYSSNQNKWIHFGYTYNGSCPTNVSDTLNSINFYFNGILYTSGKNSTALAGFNTSSETISYSSNQRFRVASRWALGSVVQQSAVGVSRVEVYNRALSASEVLQNYNATKGRFGL